MDIVKTRGMRKSLYIIAGCNGAGKTTASYSVLPHSLNIKEFVNADEIARGLSPFNPEGMAIKAGRLMLERIDGLIKQKASFAIETTLATRSYVNLVREAHRQGYAVHVLFSILRMLPWLVEEWQSVWRTAVMTYRGML